MSLSLNAYQRYIDLQSVEGGKLYTAATNCFESPLLEGAKTNLVSQDFHKINDQMNRLGAQFGFDHLFKCVPKTCMLIDNPAAVPPVLPVVAIAARPQQVIFGSHYNMLETNMALINASVFWNNDSFTKETPQIIRKMTITNRLARGQQIFDQANPKKKIFSCNKYIQSSLLINFWKAFLKPLVSPVNSSKMSTLGLAQMKRTKKWTDLTFLLLSSITFNLITRSTCILK